MNKEQLTKEELAKRLDGNEYGNEVSDDDIKDAQRNGLLIIFGYSDDNMEFRGAFNDEVGCYDGGEAYVSIEGIERNECDNEECPNFEQHGKKIKAIWNAGGYSWVFETDIPHASFDILEDGDKYCRGIVIDMNDI